jgi:hypothetical protein
MTIKVDTVTAPSVWACYLINGDASGLEDVEIKACDAWCDSIAPWYVVDVARDENGEGDEPRFTWSYRLHGGDAEGGEVLDYVVHS